jgi:hypothetical protein
MDVGKLTPPTVASMADFAVTRLSAWAELQL